MFSLFYFFKMLQQIRQGNSLLTPFATQALSPDAATTEHETAIQTAVPTKKPLDFLLPFTVAANISDGLKISENLRTITEGLTAQHPIQPKAGDYYLLDFLIAEKRLPFITDQIKPWQYQGWLLSYIILANVVRSDVANRWGWWAACHLKGELVREPIPQIHFESEFGQGAKDAFKIIDRCLEIIGRGTGGSWSSFTDFIGWLAWSCGVGQEKPRFNDKTEEELYRAFNLEPFLTVPSDYLGQHLAEQKGKGWNPNAFFPTPHAVCELMAQINFSGANDSLDARMLTVCDPAVGSGRQLMHASNKSVRLYGMDIDNLMVKICLINGAMFVPWMSFPFPNKWFEHRGAAHSRKPDEKFALATEQDNQTIAAKILQKLKVNSPNIAPANSNENDNRNLADALVAKILKAE